MAKYGKKAGEKVGKAMHERKKGTLKSGSGQTVKSKKQAIAIGLSEAREEGGKVPGRTTARKKSSAKKSARKKSSPQKSARRKTSKKSASRKSAPRKKLSARKSAARKSTKKTARKKSSAKKK